MDLYQANILDHYKHPHYHGKLVRPSAEGLAANLSCGDSLQIAIKVNKDKLVDAAFQGEGCVLSQATASILLTEAVGKELKEIASWDKQKIIDLLKVQIGPTRLQCALLSLDALQSAIKKL